MYSCGPSRYYQPTFSNSLKSKLCLIYCDFFWSGSHDKKLIENLSMRDIIEQVDTIRATLNLEKISLIGHSAFGFIALSYAKIYPDRALCLILIGSPPVWYPDLPDKATKYFQRYASDSRKKQLEINLNNLER